MKMYNSQHKSIVGKWPDLKKKKKKKSDRMLLNFFFMLKYFTKAAVKPGLLTYKTVSKQPKP